MWRFVLVVALAACTHTNAVQCEVGTDFERTCPGGNVCDDVHHLCAVADQLTNCVGMPDEAECTAGPQAGFCDMGVCVPLRCGDGVAIGGEPCDGNDFHGQTCLDYGYYTDSTPTSLTCTASCEIHSDHCEGLGSCGDGIIQPDHEFCDGNEPSVSCTDYGYGTGPLSCVRCGPGFEACKFFGWHKPSFTAGTMFDIDSTSDTNVWAVGQSAQVKHFDGADWRTFDLSVCGVDSAASLMGIDVVGDEDVWIAGRDQSSHGLVIHIVGATCTTYVTPTSPASFTSIAVTGANDIWLAANGVTHFDGTTFTQVDATSASHVVAVGSDIYSHGNGTLSVRHWDGTSWTTLAIPGTPGVYSIAGASATDLYVGGSQNGAALVTHWDGTSWTPLLQNLISSNNVTSIQPVGTRLFIGLNGSGAPFTSVYEYDGAGWTSLSGPVANGRMLVTATPGHLYGIATSSSQLFRYDGTAIFSEAPPGSVMRAIALRQDLAFAVMLTGDLYAWNGNTWTKDNGVTGATDVATDGAGSIYTIGSSGLRTRTLATTTWTTLDAAARGSRLWVISSTDIWLLDATTKRTLLHFDGTATDVLPCGTCTSASGVTDLWGTGSDVFAIENGNEAMHWNGSAWTTSTTPPQLAALYGWAPNDVIAISGVTGALYHYDGTAWTMATSAGLFASTLWGTSESDIFVGNSQGAVVHYNGSRWSPVDVASSGIKVIAGAGDSIFFFDAAASSSHRLVRTTPW